MGVQGTKTLRLKLRTGELLIRKDEDEFFTGKKYFVFFSISEDVQSFPLDNVLSVDRAVNGMYLRVYPIKKG